MEQGEINYIKKHFNSFFEENGFTLKSSSSSDVIFENKCSELIFSYEVRYQPIFEGLYCLSKSSGKKYAISNLFELLNKDSKFKEVLKGYMGEFGDLKMTDIQAYSIILTKYFGNIFKECDFSWEK